MCLTCACITSVQFTSLHYRLLRSTLVFAIVHVMSNEPVGVLIARARHRKRMSQVKLAEALGVSPSTVANWERGASYPAKCAGLVEELLGITIPAREQEAAAS
jgi:DNA-binding XRE family transcriptional regulator